MDAEGSELPLVHALRRAEASADARWRRSFAGGGTRIAHSVRPPEGYLEGFANIYSEAARAIYAKRNGGKADPSVIYPTIDDGMRGMTFVDACVRSSERNGAWIKV